MLKFDSPGLNNPVRQTHPREVNKMGDICPYTTSPRAGDLLLEKAILSGAVKSELVHHF
jgi:hypothetical protein